MKVAAALVAPPAVTVKVSCRGVACGKGTVGTKLTEPDGLTLHEESVDGTDPRSVHW